MASIHHARLGPWLAAALLPSGASAADLAFKPPSLAFGSTALTELRTVQATFQNRSALPVHLANIRLAGANAADYSQVNNCPESLPAQRSCAFIVTFKPQALTARTAELTLATDDPDQPSVALPLSGNPYPGALNDTGVTQCGDVDHNGMPCPVPRYPEQDAEYGRDSNPKTNSDANGHAGFNFTKLDSAGRAAPAATRWDCVRDNVTGLVWERKPDGDHVAGNQGLHDADDTYTWYSTETGNNSGFAGAPNEGNSCAGYSPGSAASWCNTSAYVKRVNASGWCGFKDWRLPTRSELLSLADLSLADTGQVLSQDYFPDLTLNWYWSASPSALYTYQAWMVNMHSGFSDYKDRDLDLGVLLVRGGQ